MSVINLPIFLLLTILGNVVSLHRYNRIDYSSEEIIVTEDVENEDKETENKEIVNEEIEDEEIEDEEEVTVVKFNSNRKAPKSLDWRHYDLVSEVKNQSTCNSCFAFSIIGYIEGQYAKLRCKDKISSPDKCKPISLSAQQALDCSQNGTCKAGGLLSDVLRGLRETGGVMLDTDYTRKYENKKGQCDTDRSKVAIEVTGQDQFPVKDEEHLKQAVYKHGPLPVCLNVTDDFTNYKIAPVSKPSSKDIFMGCRRNYHKLNHCVLLIGYGTSVDGIPYWILKNSWTTGWGDEGYMYLLRGKRACNIARHEIDIATFKIR